MEKENFLEMTADPVNVIHPESGTSDCRPDPVNEIHPERETSESRPEPEKRVTDEELAKLIEEAEQRGYLRGLNRNASELFNRPVVGDQAQTDDNDLFPEGEVLILKNLRRSVWD